MTVTTLDLLALDGASLDPSQYAFATASQVSVNTLQDTFTVNAGTSLVGAAFQSVPAFPSSPVQIHITPTPASANVPSISLPDSTLTSEATFRINFTQSDQPVAFGPGLHEFYTVVGWNADSVLLKETFEGSPGAPWEYLIISDQSLANGQIPDDSGTHAGNTYTLASAATPDIGGQQLVETSDPTVTCFAAGTRIATPSGAVAVEDLAEGDLVCTLSGTAQPIAWIGERRFDCPSHPQPGRVTPVQIEAGAFGPGLPVRDLVLSPEHALFFGGALIPVHCLVNGTTVCQVPVAEVTYYHLELPRHDAIFAEGLPAETYLDTGSRQSLIRRDARFAQAA